MLKKLAKLFEDAKTSAWGLKKLNFALKLGIPFNSPHGIKLIALSDNKAQSFIPYKRKNLNHIKGIHACAMATVAEFCSGLLLLSRLDPAKYRLIMQEMKVNYLYQGKSDITATFELSEEALNQELKTPLEKEGVVLYTAKINLHDVEKNLVAEAHTTWQIKSWEKVKMKV
ncbi:MAG: DUF4442 domain-containing protein [Luteibaculum sp.]